MFPSVAAVWVFHFLEWTESLCVARLNLETRRVLQPILLQLTGTAVRRASGVRGHRVAYLSHHFPAFNIVCLWRLSCGYLKEILGTSCAFSKSRHSRTLTSGNLGTRTTYTAYVTALHHSLTRQLADDLETKYVCHRDAPKNDLVDHCAANQTVLSMHFGHVHFDKFKTGRVLKLTWLVSIQADKLDIAHFALQRAAPLINGLLTHLAHHRGS